MHSLTQALISDPRPSDKSARLTGPSSAVTVYTVVWNTGASLTSSMSIWSDLLTEEVPSLTRAVRVYRVLDRVS